MKNLTFCSALVLGCQAIADEKDPGFTDSPTTTHDSDTATLPGDSGDWGHSGDTDTPPCDKLTWYRDADGDGFGDPAATALGCTAPKGFVADPSDCDDRHPAAYTGAVEHPTDGLDNDCDGVTSMTAVVDLSIWEASGSNSGAALGSNVATGDFNGDGAVDVVLGGKSIPVDESSRGAPAWVVAGPFSPDKTNLEGALPFASFYATLGAGVPALCDVGDLDGDGAEDLLVGSPGSGGHSEGSLLIARGPLDGLTDLNADPNTLVGSASGQALGLCAAPGDLDGDGTPDVVVSASGTDNIGGADGSVYVIRGPADVKTVAEADQVLQGEEYYERIGFSMAALGDLNGDGAGDYGVGNYYGETLTDGLATYLVTDYVPGLMHPRDVGVTVHYDLSTATRILTASRIGDVNGDGYADVALGSGDIYTGLTNIMSVVEGPFGSEPSLQLSEEAAITFGSSVGGPYLGLSSATTLGDWNGDGQGGIAIGAPLFANDLTDDCAESITRCADGAVFLVAAPIDPGVYDLATTADRISGSYPGGQMGGGAWGGGLQGDTDLDGEGTPDLVFAAAFANTDTVSQAGSAYILFGPGAH